MSSDSMEVSMETIHQTVQRLKEEGHEVDFHTPCGEKFNELCSLLNINREIVVEYLNYVEDNTRMEILHKKVLKLRQDGKKIDFYSSGPEYDEMCYKLNIESDREVAQYCRYVEKVTLLQIQAEERARALM